MNRKTKKYPNGYAPKIQYWTNKLAEANTGEDCYCIIQKIQYFSSKERERLRKEDPILGRHQVGGYSESQTYYPNGYVPKIQYWANKLVEYSSDPYLAGKALSKLGYFMGREETRLNTIYDPE